MMKYQIKRGFSPSTCANTVKRQNKIQQRNEKFEAIAQLRKEGKTYIEIQKQLKTSNNTIYKALKEVKLNKTMYLSKRRLNKMLKLRNNGWSYKEISQKFNTPYSTVYNALHKK